MIDKSDYRNIEIPDELDAVVEAAVSEGKYLHRKSKLKNILKKTGVMAAVFAVCVISLLNISPVFAQAAYKVPVIGDLCRIVTFREYHLEDQIKYIDVKIPKIESTGNSELEKRVNLEIQKKINDCIEENEKVAQEYYEAFVETGGKPEEFTPVGIIVDYEIKSANENYVSFVISQYETAFHAYNYDFYYNVDLETGRIFTLKDWYGNDYRKIVADNIEQTIAGWSDEQKEVLWDDLSILDLIDENTDFNINQDGQMVIVFSQYEVAYGAAGVMEFVIQAER